MHTRYTCLFACLVLLCTLLCASANAGNLRDIKYDLLIKESCRKWWPRTIPAHWSWWKAQLYQESLLEVDAESQVGAKGLAQFMPATWKDISKQLGYGTVSPHVAKYAIDAGAYYMAKLYRGWSAKRADIDRWDLARASYNAGFGNLLKAQKIMNGASSYAEIIKGLPYVTGKNSKETITYVKRIHRWQGELECGSLR